MFRTSSGNTGLTAYRYEAQQIANAQRELDERAARLAQAIADELPADATALISLASKRYPDATRTADRETIQKMITFYTPASEVASILDMALAAYVDGHVFNHGEDIRFV